MTNYLGEIFVKIPQSRSWHDAAVEEQRITTAFAGIRKRKSYEKLSTQEKVDLESAYYSARTEEDFLAAAERILKTTT